MYFKNVLECSVNSKLFGSKLTEARKEKAIQCSRKRKDGLLDILDSSASIHYHKNCYITYTFINHIEQYLKRKSQQEPVASSVKRSKRVLSSSFDFKKNCLICGEYCNVIKDKKHSDRWKKQRHFLHDSRPWQRKTVFQGSSIAGKKF